MFPARLHLPSCLLLASALMLSGTAQAHFYPETANCPPPKKPFEFVTELDETEFKAKVAEYRSCLETFVNKQNEAVTKHQSAGEKAAATWKRYVEVELGGTVKPAGDGAKAQ